MAGESASTRMEVRWACITDCVTVGKEEHSWIVQKDMFKVNTVTQIKINLSLRSLISKKLARLESDNRLIGVSTALGPINIE